MDALREKIELLDPLDHDDQLGVQHRALRG
jgi:hypothetical protein